MKVNLSEKITDASNKELEKAYHQTVKKVTEDYAELRFNTAISQMMVFINDAYKAEDTSERICRRFRKNDCTNCTSHW